MDYDKKRDEYLKGCASSIGLPIAGAIFRHADMNVDKYHGYHTGFFDLYDASGSLNGFYVSLIIFIVIHICAYISYRYF